MNPVKKTLYVFLCSLLSSLGAQEPVNTIQTLESSLEKNPSNPSLLFELANLYDLSGKHLLALNCYEKRLSLEGDNKEELFWSAYRKGLIEDSLQMPKERIIHSYNQAAQYQKNRAEPIFQLAKIFFDQKNYRLGYLLSKEALSYSPPTEGLYAPEVYEYALASVLSCCCFELGLYAESAELCNQILFKKNIPDIVLKTTLNNLRLAEAKIAPNTPRFEGRPEFKKYEKKPLDLLAQFLPNNPTIFEAGGHLGIDTVCMASKWPLATIITFEPMAQAFSQLSERTKDFPQVKPYHLAVNTVAGKSVFHVCVNENETLSEKDWKSGASSLLPASNWMKDIYQEHSIEVTSVVLDTWCTENKIPSFDFLWLDLEGLELLILENSPKTLKNAKVIYTETNFQEFRKNTAQYKDLKAFLEKSGFTLIAHWYNHFFQGNAIFVRNEIL